MTLRNEKLDERAPKFLTGESHDLLEFPAPAGKCLLLGNELGVVFVRAILLGESAEIDHERRDACEHAEEDTDNFYGHA